VAPDLAEYGRRLLAAVRWRGVAMVEFKRCARTGRAALMEVNGRLWGSLQLAVASGVNFPDLMVRLARQEALPAVPAARLGLRCRWWWGDVDHLLARLRHSRERLELPPDAPSRLRLLREFASYKPGRDCLETWDADDPRPFFRETYDWMAHRLGGRG
jgi:predicted ATP-grasp superfamily ATP-dependent carboligase